MFTISMALFLSNLFPFFRGRLGARGMVSPGGWGGGGGGGAAVVKKVIEGMCDEMRGDDVYISCGEWLVS